MKLPVNLGGMNLNYFLIDFEFGLGTLRVRGTLKRDIVYSRAELKLPVNLGLMNSNYVLIDSNFGLWTLRVRGRDRGRA